MTEPLYSIRGVDRVVCTLRDAYPAVKGVVVMGCTVECSELLAVIKEQIDNEPNEDCRIALAELYRRLKRRALADAIRAEGRPIRRGDVLARFVQ
jgi:hypothetical protein